MTLVLDTSVLAAGEPVDIAEQVAISVVTVAELPVDGAVAASYAHLAAMVHRTGRTSRTRAFDLLIAATAHAHGAAVATRNPADLAGIERDVRVVSLGPAAG